ncbi:MAG: sensor histidine kinase, partial [Bacilli bacterium]|nr:sensor histidine kinase [Bacilli bacterium]
TVSIYAIVACLLALFIQVVLSHLMRQEQETRTVRLLWEEERKQFEVSKKTMEVMSIKYHDLKHRLRDMSLPPEEVESIKETMRVYGSKVKTGNEALDVLLSETNLACSNEGIILTYTGNGQDFSFMKVTDVYSLFGNAVSNAVEAVEKVTDPEKKVIDILSERKGEMIIVHVTNYCLGDVKFQNGLPKTTKQTEEGFHGYGMKSMQMIAHKYGGNIEARLDDDLFHLGIYLLAK